MQIGNWIGRLLVLCTAATTGGALAAGMGGEEWDCAMSVEMQGMKMPMPGTKVCVRPEDGNAPPVEKHCELKEHRIVGGTTSFRIVCGPPEPGELKGQFTRRGDRVEGRYTMTQGSDTMTVVAVGTKLGACDPTKPLRPAGRK
ncbi:MAG: hypothetical protein ABT20_18210 [Rubrivivax sp. SCN 70-15]|nr:MAG: hypothetical protein ABT20_18210 [Rubrivivax sp. SCN 70-15]